MSDPNVKNATLGVKFAQRRVILDEWYLVGGTPLTRAFFRIKHPIVYSKRGLLKLYGGIKRCFIKEHAVPLGKFKKDIK